MLTSGLWVCKKSLETLACFADNEFICGRSFHVGQLALFSDYTFLTNYSEALENS